MADSEIMVSEEEFKSYVEWRLNEKGLFERGFIQSLRGSFTQLSVEPRSEPAYLASFASLAGGWNTDVGRLLIDEIGMESIDDLSTVELTPLSDSAEYHPHRHMNYQEVDSSVGSLDSLVYDGTEVSSISEFIEQMYEKKQLEGSSAAFDEAMFGLKQLDSFGRIAAFDYLEVLIRAHGHDWMNPDQLRLSHIKTSKPKQMFEKIYDLSVGDAAAQQHLDDLQRWAQLEQGLSRTEAVLDIESCLCTFESDLDDGWSRGDCV
jgi:hypothetical protein